jgi:hypothetical protein
MFAAAILLTASAQAIRYGDVAVQITSNGGASTFGYVYYRVTIANAGTVPHTVEVLLPEETSGYGNYVRRIGRTVTVPPGAGAVVSLFQPPLAMRGVTVTIAIDGRVQPERLQIDRVSHSEGHWQGAEFYSILLSRQIGFDDVNKGMEAAFGTKESRSGYMGGNKPFSAAIAQEPVSGWSQNWLSYSRFNGVFVTSGEWQTMPPGVKSALLEYVRCGGSLLTVGANVTSGAGVFETSDEQIFRTEHAGFGRFVTTARSDIGSWRSDDWDVLKKGWQGASRNLGRTKDIKEANDWFPVISNLSIPVRGLLVIVLVFTVVVGPVNIFVLSRKKRQIWLLWTVPALSLVTSVIVFGYATFAEGWSGYSRIESMTVLDESANLASTVGIAAFYCPLTPRDGLRFSYETECTPQVERNRWSGGSARAIDWSVDQHLSSGWIKSRVPSHFKLRKSQMRRERIVFSQEGDTYTALNGFGVAVDSLYYRGPDGRVYTAQDVAAGAKVKLQPAEAPPEPNAISLAGFFERDWYVGMKDFESAPATFLKANCYAAIVTEPLFIERPLKKLKRETTKGVVFGICREDANAG